MTDDARFHAAVDHMAADAQALTEAAMMLVGNIPGAAMVLCLAAEAMRHSALVGMDREQRDDFDHALAELKKLSVESSTECMQVADANVDAAVAQAMGAAR
jgi:hypothetical protein